MDAGEPEKLPIARFSQAICEALASMGVEAEVDGRNDITVQGKKISGTAQRLHQGRILHHGTLLFSSDLERIAQALTVDPEKYQSRSTKSIQSRVGNLCDYLPQGTTVEDFKLRLLYGMSTGGFAPAVRTPAAHAFAAPTPAAHASTGPAQMGLTPAELTPLDIAEIHRLADQKYTTWEWNYGASPPYTIRHKARFEGGALEITADVKKGIVDGIAFRGDFMARVPQDTLVAALIGCRFERGEVSAIIAGFPLEEMFGGIKGEEILKVLFDG
jgi:lipoate-protein ligase A